MPSPTHRRRLWPAALLTLAPVLAACADDADPAAGDPTSTAPVDRTSSPTAVTSAPTSSATASASASVTAPTSQAPPSPTATAGPVVLPAACAVVARGDLSAAYGMTFTEGRARTGSNAERGLRWTSDNCSFVAPGLAEVVVKLTGTDDFTEGTFRCPRPPETASIVEPVDDIAGASTGWWRVSDAPPLKATMRACTAQVLVDIALAYEGDYEGDPRNQSAKLAEKVLQRIRS